jgi:hypothetical protein
MGFDHWYTLAWINNPVDKTKPLWGIRSPDKNTKLDGPIVPLTDDDPPDSAVAMMASSAGWFGGLWGASQHPSSLAAKPTPAAKAS